MRILTRWTRSLQGPAQPSRHLPEVLVSTIELLINITRSLLYIVIFLCNQAEWKVEVMIFIQLTSLQLPKFGHSVSLLNLNSNLTNFINISDNK